MKAGWLRLGGTRGAELGGAGWPKSGGGTCELRRSEVRDGADSRARLTERRGRDGKLRRREPKGKTYFRKYTIDKRAERLGQAGGLQPVGEGRPAGAGWAKGRVGRKVGLA
jgi:hypothetical protein